MTTPGDLRAMRLLLGYTREELGILLGGIHSEEIRKMERTVALYVFADYAALVAKLLADVNAMIETAMGEAPPRFLITFPNDDAFRHYDPARAAWMHFNSAHLMFTARLYDAWIAEGHKPEVIELVADYEQYRIDSGAPDSEATRLAWAESYRPKIVSRAAIMRPDKETS